MLSPRKPCVEKMQFIFFVPPNEELERVHCTPKNVDVPPKMKVKGYMYPQMKKPVGILFSEFFIIGKTGNSRSRFRYFIFEIFGKMTNYAVFLPSLLSISTKR
jgi:hypothetical protein